MGFLGSFKDEKMKIGFAQKLKPCEISDGIKMKKIFIFKMIKKTLTFDFVNVYFFRSRSVVLFAFMCAY